MTNKLSISLLALSIFITSSSKVLAASRIYFDPTTINVKKDQEFTLPVKVDVESNQVIGSDISINFSSDDLTLVGVDNANFFPEFTWAGSNTNTLEIHAFSSSIHQTKTGAGVIANLKFKAKRDGGSSTTTFACSSAGNDTNILNNNGSNILSCSSLNQALIVFQSTKPELSPSPSPSPSNTNSNSNNSNSNTQPPVCSALKLDPTTANSVPRSVSLLCYGRDSDSDITSAIFNFGDGTTQTITKNIGRDSSFSTAHTYTKAGTYKVTCKLKDATFTANECSSTLTLTSPVKPSATPNSTIKPSSTPNGRVLALVDEDTSPTPSSTLAPVTTPTTLDSEEDTTTNANILWWIFGSVILVGIGVFIFVKILKSTSTPIPPAEL